MVWVFIEGNSCKVPQKCAILPVKTTAACFPAIWTMNFRNVLALAMSQSSTSRSPGPAGVEQALSQ